MAEGQSQTSRDEPLGGVKQKPWDPKDTATGGYGEVGGGGVARGASGGGKEGWGTGGWGNLGDGGGPWGRLQILSVRRAGVMDTTEKETGPGTRTEIKKITHPTRSYHPLCGIAPIR